MNTWGDFDKSALDRWLTTDPENQPAYRIPEDYHSETAPCGHDVWGTNADIDSGIRRHLESCYDYDVEEFPDEEQMRHDEMVDAMEDQGGEEWRTFLTD